MPRSSTSWQPGQSGNPNGRPKGSRDTLTESFIKDLAEAWEEYGADAIQRVAKDQPVEFLKLAARLVPKESRKTLTADNAFLRCLEMLNRKPGLPGDGAKVIDGEAVPVLND